MGEIINTIDLPEDLHYSTIPFDRFEDIFTKSKKDDRTLHQILTSEANSAIYYVGTDLVKYEKGHTEKSAKRLLDLRDQGEEVEIPEKVIHPTLLAMTQSNVNGRAIIDVRDVLSLHHSAWWKVRNGGDQDFYLRDNQPAGRSPMSGEWLPNDIACNQKYLFSGDCYEIFTEFEEKGINFKKQRIPSGLLENKNYRAED